MQFRPFSAQIGQRLQQPMRIRMKTITKKGLKVAFLNNPSRIHYGKPVRILGNQAEIMGNQQD